MPCACVFLCVSLSTLGPQYTCRAQRTTLGTGPQFPPCLNLVTLVFDAVYQLAGLGTSCLSSFLHRGAEVTETLYSTQFLCKFQTFKLKSSHLYNKCFLHSPISTSSPKPFHLLVFYINNWLNLGDIEVNKYER